MNPTLTRLEGVNQILRAIGSRPVNTLSPPSPPDALGAIAKLDEVTRRTNDEGWDLNQEAEITLSPDVNDNILVPNTVLRLDYRQQHRWHKNIVVRRNGGVRMLYNETDQTFEFQGPIKVDVVRLIEFEDLEHSHQHYVCSLAALELADQSIGDQTRRQSLLSQAALARAGVMRAELEGGGYSILDPIPNTLRRNPAR